MANELIVRALKANAKKINLSSRNIDTLPKSFSRLTWVLALQLNNNSLASLPPELQSLRQLAELNLGNNDFEDIPAVLKRLNSLKKLYLFGNKISSLHPDILEGLPNLRLKEIPAELGLLKKLTEINLNNNKLTEIPQQLYNLTQLRKLHLARNNLTDLPEVGCTLVSSTQLFQILHCQSMMVTENLNKLSVVSRALSCALCLQPFLTTWVECVQFINLQKDMGIKRSQNIPVRVLLCSYSCFNKSGHSYYGVAKI
uniref:Leucine rich repeat containing 69 n=1 Tax=Electrophorus electricus TaxID=8005 RepID=A0AAY5EJI6_ELEEL